MKSRNIFLLAYNIIHFGVSKGFRNSGVKKVFISVVCSPDQFTCLNYLSSYKKLNSSL